MIASLLKYASEPTSVLNARSEVTLHAGDIAVMRHFHDPLVMPIVNVPFVSFSLRCRFKSKRLHSLLVNIADVVDVDSSYIIKELADHAQFNPRLIQHIKSRSRDYCSWFAVMIHAYETEPGIHDVDFIRVSSGNDFARARRRVSLELTNVLRVGNLVMCSSHDVPSAMLEESRDDYLQLLGVMTGYKRMKEVS